MSVPFFSQSHSSASAGCVMVMGSLFAGMVYLVYHTFRVSNLAGVDSCVVCLYDECMTTFFRDNDIRRMLVCSLESTYGLDLAEWRGVPDDYAFALSVGSPRMVAETFFRPWLTDFIRMAYSDFKGRSEAERDEVVQLLKDNQLPGENVLEAFLKFCDDSHQISIHDSLPKDIDKGNYDELRHQVGEVTFHEFILLGDDLGELYSKELTEFSMSSMAYSAVWHLANFLCTAALIPDSSVVPTYPVDAVPISKWFARRTTFYEEAFRSYRSFVTA